MAEQEKRAFSDIRKENAMGENDKLNGVDLESEDTEDLMHGKTQTLTSDMLPGLGEKNKKERRAARDVIVATTKNWDKRDINRGIILALALVVVVIVSMLLTKISVLGNFIGTLLSAMTPVFIGMVFAYILNPLHNFFIKVLKKLLANVVKPRQRLESLANGLGLTLTIFAFLGLIIGLLAILLPQLKDSLVSLYQKVPEYINNIKETLSGWFSGNESILNVINNYLNNFEDTLSHFINDTLLPNMDTILAKVSSGIMDGVLVIIDIFVGLIVAIYLLAQKKKLAAQSKKLLYSFCSKKRGNKVLDATAYVNSVFGGFVTGKIVDSLMIGVICAIFCSIVGMPYGLLCSVIIAITNIIPFFGPIIGLVPSGLLILVEEPKMALLFVIFVIVIQQLDANLLQPIILGDATGLSGLWVLLAITVGSGMFGLVGMVLSVPVFAIIYTLFNMYMRYRLRHKELSNNTEYYYDLIGFDDDGNPIRGVREKTRPGRKDKLKADAARDKQRWFDRRAQNKAMKQAGDAAREDPEGVAMDRTKNRNATSENGDQKNMK